MSNERKLLAAAIFIFWLVQLFGWFIEEPFTIALIMVCFQVISAVLFFIGVYQIKWHGNSRWWAMVPFIALLIILVFYIGSPSFMIWRMHLVYTGGQ
jgi:hypothetical protein